MQPTVSLISIGDELLNGRTQDTNSHFLSSGLTSLGLKVLRVLTVKDCRDDIARALEYAQSDSQVIFTTGGLGPTEDDFTRDVIAEVCGAPLEISDSSLEKLERIAASKGRKLYENGKHQAQFPKGARVIDNPLGTADAFVSNYLDTPIISLPGVPREMKELFKGAIGEFLLDNLKTLKNNTVRQVRIFGLSESYIGQVVSGLGLDDDLTIAYRPTFPEVMVSVSSGDEDKVLEATSQIKAVFGEEFIFSELGNQHLVEVLVELLLKENKTLAVSESCTGGMIASDLVSIPGVSRIFKTGVTAYSNQAKTDFLSVSEDTLAKHGAVSEAVAVELAKNVREKSAADFGISTTGIAGPEGGSEEKPAGTVWIGLADSEGASAFLYNLPYPREGFRRMASTVALDKLRRKLLGLPLTWELK